MDPIGHDPPYKRININDPMPVTKAPDEGYYERAQRLAEEKKAEAEAERIWKLVRKTCGDDIETEPQPAPEPEPPATTEVDWTGGAFF